MTSHIKGVVSVQKTNLGFNLTKKKGLYIVGSRGSSQLGGSLLGIPLGYKRLTSVLIIPSG